MLHTEDTLCKVTALLFFWLQTFCVFLFLIGASLFGTLLSRLNEILQVFQFMAT